MNKRNGITLIALIITIIVLIVLAGISISMLTGENGILSKAKTAKEQTDITDIEEQNRLGTYNDSIDKYTSSRGSVTLTTEEYTQLVNDVQLAKNDASYSEDEKQIGTWTDGTNLYKKTLNTTTPSSNIAAWDLSSWNIKKVVNVYGMIARSDGYNMPLIYSPNTSDMQAVWFNSNYTQMGFYTVLSTYYSQKANITIEYTKN